MFNVSSLLLLLRLFSLSLAIVRLSAGEKETRAKLWPKFMAQTSTCLLDTADSHVCTRMKYTVSTCSDALRHDNNAER